MEIVLFMLDAVAMLLLLLGSLKNDRRAPGTPPAGPFRYHVAPPAPVKGSSPRQTARNASRL